MKERNFASVNWPISVYNPLTMVREVIVFEAPTRQQAVNTADKVVELYVLTHTGHSNPPLLREFFNSPTGSAN